MPIYEYECQNCGKTIEVIQKVSDSPLLKCDSCGQDRLQKLVSSTQFQLKGSGWYATDYKNKETKPKPETDKKEDKSTDTKSSGGSDSGSSTND